MANDYTEQCVRYMLDHYHSAPSTFDFILKLEQLTGLVFIATPSAAESLCFADNEAVRDDYKMGFTAADLWAYVNDHLYSSHSQQNIDLFLQSIFPISSDQFWQAVKQGRA